MDELREAAIATSFEELVLLPNTDQERWYRIYAAGRILNEHQREEKDEKRPRDHEEGSKTVEREAHCIEALDFLIKYGSISAKRALELDLEVLQEYSSVAAETAHINLRKQAAE